MTNNSNNFEFIINEDGSITRRNYSPLNRSSTTAEYCSRPTILKFNCSSDHMRCGDSVTITWGIQDAARISMCISQGGYSTTEDIPNEGEITLKSNISSDDITIIIMAKNNCGVSSSRKNIYLKKRENTVQTNIGATVIYIIAIVIFIFLLITRFI